VRRHDAAHGLVLHVLELRQQHRLRVIDLWKTRPCRSNDASCQTSRHVADIGQIHRS
jgi:hypothetical protein